MSVEENIMKGNVKNVIDAIPSIGSDNIGALFLFAITFEQEDIASSMLEQRSEDIPDQVLSEAFRSAAAHNETVVISKILKKCPQRISKITLLDALQMAVAKCYVDVLLTLSGDDRVSDIINTEDENNPHVIMLAIDQGDYYFLEKLLKLPSIKVAFHHAAYATLRKQIKMSELIKLYITQQRIKEEQLREQNRYENITEYEIDQCAIGPHLDVELEKRKRILERIRVK